MKTHIIKTVQPFFSQVKAGIKTFELRRNDRDYQVGDEVILREYDMMHETFSGDKIKCIITYVLKDRVGLDDAFCIFSFKQITT